MNVWTSIILPILALLLTGSSIAAIISGFFERSKTIAEAEKSKSESILAEAEATETYAKASKLVADQYSELLARVERLDNEYQILMMAHRRLQVEYENLERKHQIVCAELAAQKDDNKLLKEQVKKLHELLRSRGFDDADFGISE